MLKILQDKNHIHSARSKLRELGLDTSIGPKRLIFKLCYGLRYRALAPPVSVNKSWDVLTMAQIVEKYFPDRGINIFEMGSYNSEISLVLWEMGYRNIRAADFNPKGTCIRWYGNRIDFQTEDYYSPDIPAESVDVIVALSVIEHGYDQKKLLNTAKRILRKGGVILLTTDYHEEKINIDEDYRLFDLTYKIFSKQEIQNLIEEAKYSGLELLGQEHWEKSHYPIEFLGHHMTFILLALKKT